jgi:putative peptide zinc metalloprotease protein
MQLGQIQPKKADASQVSKADKMEDAFEKGLKIPWLGLRPDLVLHKGAPDESGKETYVLEDPIRGEHFELGDAEAKLFLCLASEKDLKSAVEKLIKTTSLRPSTKDVLSFVNMLQQEQLAILPADTDLDAEPEPEPEPETEAEEKKEGFIRGFFGAILKLLKLIWMYLEVRGTGRPQPKKGEKKQKGEPEDPKFSLGNIYFFRIPILRPDAFLTAAYPWVSPLWSKPFLYLYGVLGIVGLIFMIQQFELYLNTASYLFTFKGIVIFMLCLGVVKVVHEFGHAFAAKHYGIYVRRMGIYMMFFAPMLYTDVSDAWKLPSRKGRVMIGAAGVLVEFYIGILALFFWSVLPDGILRSIMFYTSGAAILSTFLVNVSPFMRFDGYYVLMDYFGMSNLRSRAMMMYKYYLRKVLVDWKGPKPEEHPREHIMAIFGLGCSLYFLVIIFGIQVMVYENIDEFIAIWGMIILFLVFVASPLVKEITFLLTSRKYWGSTSKLTVRVLMLVLMIAYLFVPVQTSEMIPAFFLFKDIARIEATGPGKIVTEIPDIGTPVKKGDILIKIRDESLEQDLKRSQYALLQVEESIKNMPAAGAQGGYRTWLLAERERLSAASDKLRQGLSQLEIPSPVSGKVADVNQTLSKGSYIFKKCHILTVADEQFPEVRAYVPEKIYRSLRGNENSIASLNVVVPDLEAGLITGKFREMLDFPVTEFPNNALFDFAGGSIVTSLESKPSRKGSLKPRDPQFPIFFDISKPPAYLRYGTPCFVRIKGETISLMGRVSREFWRLMAKQKKIGLFQK